MSHQLKDPQDRNAIATLDRAIQSIKIALASEKGNWGQTLQKVVRGYNAAPNSPISDSAPNDAEKNHVLQLD